MVGSVLLPADKRCYTAPGGFHVKRPEVANIQLSPWGEMKAKKEPKPELSLDNGEATGVRERRRFNKAIQEVSSERQD
jgi:hypothetical protein